MSEKKYQHLFNFLGSYFPDADFENLSDEEVIINYIQDCNKSEISKRELEKSKEELIDLINNLEPYWEIIGKEANRYFENSKDALKWLEKIKNTLNAS